MRFSGKSLCCQGNWAYLENRPHCALTSVDKSQTKHLLLYHFRRAKKWNYSVKLGKTPDCCKILTAQFNGLYCVASSVKIRRKTYFLPGTAWRTAVSWYSFQSVNHTWKSYERFRITNLHTDPVFEVCRFPDFRLFSKCLRRKTHLSPAPVVVHVRMLSRIDKSCKEYLRLWTLTFGIVTKSKTSRKPRRLPWRRRLMTFRW